MNGLPIFLTAAAVAFFCLDTKETKNQDKGHASTRPAGSYAFLAGFIAALINPSHEKLNRYSRLYAGPRPLSWPGLF